MIAKYTLLTTQLTPSGCLNQRRAEGRRTGRRPRASKAEGHPKS